MNEPTSCRTSAWSLRDAHAPPETLERLESVPTTPENRAAIAAARFATRPDATRRTGDRLVADGFRYLGTKGESASYRPLQHLDTFVDPDETTYVLVRRKPWRTGLSRWYVVTQFDDGTCLETFERVRPVVGSHERLTVRGGCGSLVGDVRAHLREVERRAREGAKIVPVRSLDDVLRVARYHISHVTEPRVAANIASIRRTERGLFVMGASFVGLIALIVYWALTR